MDKDRQIRFLYPPLIFLCSLGLGIFLGGPFKLKSDISDFFNSTNNTSIIVALIGATSIILVLGFLIGTITILFLRAFFPQNRFNYEFKLPAETYATIGEIILKGENKTISKAERMYAAVAFDHSYIHENAHRWMARRWNAFMIASFSIVALISSLLIGHCALGVSWTAGWLLPVIIFIFIFVIQAISAWLESMRMITFMTRVKNQSDISGSETNASKEVD